MANRAAAAGSRPARLLLAALAASLLLASAAGQLQNPDYSGKASVKLSALYEKKDEPVDKSWPPAQEFAHIDVTVMGKKVNGEVGSMGPRLDQMKPKKLKKILDGDLDTNWVSIDRPKPGNETGGTAGLAALPQFVYDPKLLAQLEKMDFSSMRDDMGKLVTFDQKTVYMFKGWLMKQAACPVEYLWEDLGALFWPRWIRRGVCSSLSSCSWPPGMKCRKSGQKELKILRWVCNDKGKLGDAQDPRHGRRSVDADRRRRRRRGKRQRRRRDRAGRRRSAAGRKRRRKSRNNNRRDPDDSAAVGSPTEASSIVVGAAGGASAAAAAAPSDPMAVGRQSAVKLPEGWQTRREGQRERRRRRLILRMAKTVGDYFCYWRQINYSVTDRCHCMCS